MSARCEVLVIGAGIAGVSLAARLCARAKVRILEQESSPGAHATARSAAIFVRNYGSPSVRALTRASEAFFKNPPEGFARATLFKPRPTIEIADEQHLDALARSAALADEPEFLDREGVLALAPILRPASAARGLIDRGGGDLDVHELMSAWLRVLAAAGVRVDTDSRLVALERGGEGWRVETEKGEIYADVVVNAAGAWAGALAARAGAGALPLTPLRRTAITVARPDGQSIDDWPMVVDVDERFYFKPMSGALMISPADTTPSPPCDAAAEEIDVAVAVDRFEAATTHRVARVLSRWAGLRTFAPDENPVVGFDGASPGFFWLAGQGGFGVQTAPALSAVAAALILGKNLPHALLAAGVDAQAFAPTRFAAIA